MVALVLIVIAAVLLAVVLATAMQRAQQAPARIYIEPSSQLLRRRRR